MAGSQFAPYSVRVVLDETGIVDASCSCPYDWGGLCKDIVAILLAYLHEPGSVREPALEETLSTLGSRLRAIPSPTMTTGGRLEIWVSSCTRTWSATRSPRSKRISKRSPSRASSGRGRRVAPRLGGRGPQKFV